MKHFPFSIFNCQFFLIIVVCTLCASADACVLDVKPDQGVQLTYVETTELRGAHEGLPSPAFGEAVATCLEHGLVTADKKEYYLVADNGLLDGLMMGEPAEIRVLADVYEFVDYYGVTLLMADVKELEILIDEQYYFPEGIEWKVLDQSGDIDISEARVQVLSVAGDTTIQDNTYHLIDGYPLRQEGKKVYLFDTYSSEDVLLYDFALAPGDSILYGESYVKVVSVEQVTLQDGRPARKINYIGRASDIEYVGSVSSGLLAPYEVPLIGCYSKHLLCCSVGGEPIYETSPGACTTTALPEVEPTDSPVRKLIQDGRLVILNNGVRYTICGAKIQ